MLRISVNIYVFLVVLLSIIACNSNSQQVSGKNGKNTIHPAVGDPVKGAVKPLTYDTMSPQVKEIAQRIDKFYLGQSRAGFSGGVVVGYKGHIIYEKYFGFANKEKKIPWGPNSSCQLASISKTFTGSAVLYLYQRNKIDLDKPVDYYIKNFPYHDVTVRMCLNHRSGLPDYTKFIPVYNRDTRTPIDNDQMIAVMTEHRPHIEFKAGTRFTYCNTNFAVLAKIVEVVTDMSFREFMSTYIFRPLGMYHSFVYDPHIGLPDEAAISYRFNWVREPDMFADGVSGDKGIYSTPEDMYRWDQSFYNNTLLNNQTIELAYSPCSFERKGVKNYGLGWRMLCFPDGNKIIYHNGWWHGNNTSFYRFIKDNFTVIVLGNKFNKAIYHHASAIVGIVNGVSGKELDEEE